MNYMGDARNVKNVWQCGSCQSSVESMGHVLCCPCYAQLRADKDRACDADLAWCVPDTEQVKHWHVIGFLEQSCSALAHPLPDCEMVAARRTQSLVWCDRWALLLTNPDRVRKTGCFMMLQYFCYWLCRISDIICCASVIIIINSNSKISAYINFTNGFLTKHPTELCSVIGWNVWIYIKFVYSHSSRIRAWPHNRVSPPPHPYSI
jgi:hypothetical protein